MEIFFYCICIVLLIAATFGLTFLITKVIRKSTSPYLVFGIISFIEVLAVIIFAVVDIMTSTGMFAGLLGVLLLMIVLPVPVLMLLIDIILWFIKRNRRA